MRYASEIRQQYISPHVFVWLELLDVFEDLYKKKGGMEAELQHLAVHRQGIEEDTLKMVKLSKESVKQEGDKATGEKELHQRMMRRAVASVVKVARVNQCWNPAWGRVEATTVGHAEAVRADMFTFLVSNAKGDIRPGQAPKGSLERRIAANLEKLTKDKSLQIADLTA